MPTPRFRWNEVAGRYVDLNGRFVSRETVRLELDRALARAGDRALSISENLRSGRIDLFTWRQQMRDLIKETHLYSSAAAKGGWAQLSPADYGRVGQILAHGPRAGSGEYEYLDRFAQEIANGLDLNGRFMQRTKMYTEAARTTYHNFDNLWHEDHGFDEERSVRHVADSCDGCIAEEALGWQPAGTIRPIGTRDCLRNCRCTIEFRKSRAA